MGSLFIVYHYMVRELVMYQFSIVHLRLTMEVKKERIPAWMEGARLDGDLLEVEAYQQVLAHGEMQ